MKTRRVSIKILYKSKEITRDISQLVTAFSYNERLDGKADDIVLSFFDRDNAFIYEHFLPERGDRILPTLFFEHWYKEDEIHEIYLGEFEVDEFELNRSPGSNILSIKAVPATVKSSLSGQKKTRAWENTKLRVIAEDIAVSAQVELVYKAGDIFLARADQKAQSDLSFLSELCRQKGLRLKIADKKIIILESKEEDKRQQIAEGDFLDYSLRVQSRDVYNSVHIKYYDALNDNNFEYSYQPKKPLKVGKVLELNERVESYAEAEQVAKARLREKNAKAVELSLKLFPNPLIRCGATVDFLPVSFLGEKFIVEEMRYSLDGGQITQSLKLNLCLDY